MKHVEDNFNVLSALPKEKLLQHIENLSILI